MKKIKTIQLEIDSDKVAEFYCSLLKYKTSEEPDPKDLKMMADAIHLDSDSLMKSFETSELQEQNISEKFQSIHNYLLKSKKKSEDYFKVSEENFEKFMSSAFIADLYDIFKWLELSQKWKGKEESAEVKAGIAMYSITVYYFTDFFAEDVNRGLKKSLNNGILLSNIQNKPIKITHKKGNFCFNVGEKETEELEFFLEKNGKILKTNIKSKGIDEIFDLGNRGFLFLKSANMAIQMAKKGNTIEVINYENVKEKNKELDLANAKIVNSFSIPIEHFEESVTITEDGSYIYEPKDSSFENLITETSPLTVNKEYHPKSVQEKKEFKIDTAYFASIFNPIDELISFFLKNPQNKREEIESRNRIVTIVYDLLKKHYPDITIHTSATITGYICSNLELLDTEEQHDNSNRTQSYREYLRNSINNILASTSHIKK